MFAKVVKRFEYSDDGIRLRSVEPGEIIDFADGCAPGLVAAGLIARELVVAPISRAGDKIAAGLNDAIAIARGEVEPAHVYVSAVPNDLSVRDLGKGWFAVFRGDEKVTKSVRSKDDAEAEMAEMLKSNS